MPLAPYSEQYWYTDETFAAGQKLHIFPRFSNVHAPLYADAGGTIPLTNPVTLNNVGIASLFVENGDYWGFINGVSFYLIIDLDPNLTHVWPSTFKWDQNVAASTWVINHGLNSKPIVSTLSPADELIFGDVQYTDDDTLTIDFGVPMSGVAYLRR